MATLLGTCLQKLYVYSLNLNSLFMKSTFVAGDNASSSTSTSTAGEDQVNEVRARGPGQYNAAQSRGRQSQSHSHRDESDRSAVRRRGFYNTNLVLDTNHYTTAAASHQAAQVTTRRVTRAQLNQNKRLNLNDSGNGQLQVLTHQHQLQLQAENEKSGADSWTSSNPNHTTLCSCVCPAARVAASLKMGAIKFLGCSASTSKGRKNRLPTISNAIGNGSEKGRSGCCKCEAGGCTAGNGNGTFNNNNMEPGFQSQCDPYAYACANGAGYDELSEGKKKVYCFHEAPHYLRFNPHITHGYRGMLRPVECIKSLFWWTNETMNIWTHLFGWFFFLALSVYDFLGLLGLPNIQPLDQLMLTGLLFCFQACMLLSSLYHIFCCHSEVSYRRWLSLDLLGVSLSLLAIYVSGIYYAFSCVPFWLNFYLVTVGAIFATAMFMQILPIISKAEMVTEERFRWRLVVFGGWAAYGIIPTGHWFVLHGMSGPAVTLLLPRIFGVYALSAAAFFFYVTRVPEKVWPGLVNYIGSSHQIWHILIVAALYHWHNTGMLYLQFRAAHPCAEEYEYLFGVKYADVLE